MKSIIMEKYSEKINSELKKLGKNKTGKTYISNCTKYSILFFIFTWLLWNLFFDSLIEGILISLVVSSSGFIFLLSKPKTELNLKAKKIEKHLPFALMQLSVDLNTGIPFDKAIHRLSNGEYKELSEEFKTAIRNTKKIGSSLPEELIEIVNRNNSLNLKRTIAQLISIYEHGTKNQPGEIIRKIALEQLARQKSEAREFSDKIVVFSLCFIVISAIIPALFQAMIIVGSSFMDLSIEPIQVIIIVTIIFPLIDISILLLLKSMTPEFMKM